jgi:hypothetical protein
LTSKPYRDALYLKVVFKRDVEQLYIPRKALIAHQGKERIGHIAAKALNSALSIIETAGNEYSDKHRKELGYYSSDRWKLLAVLRAL